LRALRTSTRIRRATVYGPGSQFLHVRRVLPQVQPGREQRLLQDVFCQAVVADCEPQQVAEQRATVPPR
jgi:hypothetical protein